MFAKNPYELPPGKKFSKEEIAEALRISISAELDAINLYLQFARATEDENYRKVFEDVAKEEKTHFGEFLTLLKSLDPELVSELAAGQEEVKKLTTINIQNSKPEVSDPPQEPLSESEWKALVSKFKEVLSTTRKVREHLPKYDVGRGVEAVTVEIVKADRPTEPGSMQLVQLCELCVEFSIFQRAIDQWRRLGSAPDFSQALRAAVKLALDEDSFLIWGRKEQGINGLATIDGTLKMKMSDWEKPGSAVEEISSALSELLRLGVPPPHVLFLSPGRYTKLLSVYERTGIMELTRVKSLVKEVVQVQNLPNDLALIVSLNPSFLDVVIGTDLTIDYIGPEDGKHKFRAWETLALRVKNPKAIVQLSQERS
ncbi:MAG: family 1 encapsulin nanocompartment shell protein [Nitrososphaerota archaeon]|nr:encapsulin [Aigarchaeota archaeon]MDW8077216.1 family 1 encapsulin nanocompartment shell protein [Nitrososphaerota archaeon]